ncbi:DUF1800 domain-containing protein [Acidimangrovimonas sediminis]|uniref:DUF1800 domain-containing protein n=1 Tax=Acidimangrovimonas sediminis TaxID=2056283 RepID=UPI000C807830|nr:DUF1800 domain-containing protein [Acidimangrovimonas sediminis]
MSFSPTTAAIRFGYGLSPTMPPPASTAALMAELTAPDAMATRYPLPSQEQAVTLGRALRDARALQKTEGDRSRNRAVRAARLALRGAEAEAFVNQLQRAVQSPHGFRERLQYFWSNHFTVQAKNNISALYPTAFGEEAIRPHLGGSFADMLKAATTHPAMLLYLDQNSSIGPKSRAAKRMDARRKRQLGLNENLARELMELHTLGVSAPYTQTDVRQMAKLLTGLGFNSEGGFVFRPGWAEPGAETVLGRHYGGEEPARLADIFAALDDIAVNPATAKHISTQLATHFVADTPDPGLVTAMTQAYTTSKGDLPTVYRAMFDHPAAWAPVGPGGKARQPWDFIAASLRSLGLPPDALDGLDAGRVQRFLTNPIKLMGQPWQKPSGPDGWHEEATAWITPQGLAARIDWAMKVNRFLTLADAGPTPARGKDTDSGMGTGTGTDMAGDGMSGSMSGDMGGEMGGGMPAADSNAADTPRAKGRAAGGDPMPDPRAFVQTALADAASPTLIQAAARSESRAEGVGLILASADFNRR